VERQDAQIARAPFFRHCRGAAPIETHSAYLAASKDGSADTGLGISRGASGRRGLWKVEFPRQTRGGLERLLRYTVGRIVGILGAHNPLGSVQYQ